MSRTLITEKIDADWHISLQLLIHQGASYKANIKLCEFQGSGKAVSVVMRSVDGTSCPLNAYFRILNSTKDELIVIEACLQNPSAMSHPGGNWDLGATGNVLIDSCDLTFVPKDGSRFEDLRLHLLDSGQERVSKEFIEVHQASSGGKAWKSQNHVDRTGENRLPFHGYRVTSDQEKSSGDRAVPVLTTSVSGQCLSIAVRDFWQNFPIKLGATTQQARLSLFASESNSPTELQGGEQKTFEFAISRSDEHSNRTLEAWIEGADQPDEATLEKIRSFFPHFSKCKGGRDRRYEDLVNLAIKGENSFFHKRETIDEYGWRNFGDIWADHEAVFHRGESPLISHNNNQYDCILGLAIQYLRSGNQKWWDLLIPMANHVWDIDTYHTSKDKLAYNGGLFWHTYHYADAHTSTHRSYPKKLHLVHAFDDGQDLSKMGATGESLAQNYQIGGGPAASHNYSTGWVLAYHLTGKARYKDAVLNAAEYVMRLEDGLSTPYKWLSRAETGYSTESASGYFGPGRASANSTHALLSGHELSGDDRYLNRVAKIMRRTVHPHQDLEELDLHNVELRWFYTMYLQSLCRYIDYKVKLNQLDSDFEYGVASLRRYAKWMTKHEGPSLSQPDKLQYPTETWAAQDMRKWYILEYAARYSEDDSLRMEMRARADFFYDYVLDYLNESATKALCRPVTLMLNMGWQRQWFLQNRETPAFTKKIEKDFGRPQVFIPQRVIAIRRFKILAIAGAASLLGLILFVSYLIFQR